MKTLRVISAVIVVLGFSVVANAQATRTWVSGVGDDVNPCSRTAPCKTFAGAISKTASCGEISVLDPGGFGAVTITKSISLNGEGTLAGILAAGVSAIIVNGNGIVVSINNLSLNGACTGIHGVNAVQFAALNIEHCQIYNFGTAGTSAGVFVNVGATQSKVRIADTQIWNNAKFGVSANAAGGGKVRIVLSNVGIFGTTAAGGSGGSAVDLNSNVSASIFNSQLTENNGAGIFMEQTSADANVFGTTLSDNLFGLFLGNGGSPTCRVYGSQITNNSTDGIHIAAGSALTHGNNAVQNNAGAQAFTGASLGTQ